MHALDCATPVVPIIPPERRDEEAVARLAESFNRWGELCRSEGLTFSYHNHAFEFAPVGETKMWDALIRDTDPELVHLELDLYWVRYGGVDRRRYCATSGTGSRWFTSRIWPRTSSAPTAGGRRGRCRGRTLAARPTTSGLSGMSPSRTTRGTRSRTCSAAYGTCRR
jgi:hypothetical protein